MRKLPSLNALKAFEACGRNCSFTLAADELLVSQSAVSRQVKALEDYLGVRLFAREPRRLKLTRHGEKLLQVLTGLFDQLAAAVSHAQLCDSIIRIRMPPTFGIRWLIPRLSGFQQENPDIEVLFSTGWNPVNFARDEFDAGIICSVNKTDYDDSINVSLVAEEALTAVCSPEILRDEAPLIGPADIQRYTLLHGSEEHDYWRDWFEAAGVPINPDVRSQSYDLMDTSLYAAVRGFGIALAPPQYVVEDLALGRLVIPFPKIAPTISAYYFVWPKNSASKYTETFHQWLLKKARADWVRGPLGETLHELQHSIPTGPRETVPGLPRTGTDDTFDSTCRHDVPLEFGGPGARAAGDITVEGRPK